jgi:hypothetical protein
MVQLLKSTQGSSNLYERPKKELKFSHYHYDPPYQTPLERKQYLMTWND